jgi:hypothetical protein
VRRKSFIAALVGLAVLASPAATQQFRSENRMTVTPLGNGSFEVSGRSALWARDYWCAAGDYGQRVLGLPVTARLVVTAPYEKAGRSVVFGPVADAAPQFRAVVMGLSIRSAGTSLSVGQARGFCADYRLRNSF